MPRPDAAAAAHPGDRAAERAADRRGLGLRGARRQVRPVVPEWQPGAARLRAGRRTSMKRTNSAMKWTSHSGRRADASGPARSASGAQVSAGVVSGSCIMAGRIGSCLSWRVASCARRLARREASVNINNFIVRYTHTRRAGVPCHGRRRPATHDLLELYTAEIRGSPAFAGHDTEKR